MRLLRGKFLVTLWFLNWLFCIVMQNRGGSYGTAYATLLGRAVEFAVVTTPWSPLSPCCFLSGSSARPSAKTSARPRIRLVVLRLTIVLAPPPIGELSETGCQVRNGAPVLH
jgi:hypothetical protein